MAWTQHTMMAAIARKTHPLDTNTAKKVVVAVTVQAGAYWTGCKWLTWIFAKIPGPTMAVGAGANSVLNSPPIATTFARCVSRRRDGRWWSSYLDGGRLAAGEVMPLVLDVVIEELCSVRTPCCSR
jgi:hypothetical protein